MMTEPPRWWNGLRIFPEATDRRLKQLSDAGF